MRHRKTSFGSIVYRLWFAQLIYCKFIPYCATLTYYFLSSHHPLLQQSSIVLPGMTTFILMRFQRSLIGTTYHCILEVTPLRFFVTYPSLTRFKRYLSKRERLGEAPGFADVHQRYQITIICATSIFKDKKQQSHLHDRNGVTGVSTRASLQNSELPVLS